MCAFHVLLATQCVSYFSRLLLFALPFSLSARPHCSKGHLLEHPLNLLVTVFFFPLGQVGV